MDTPNIEATPEKAQPLTSFQEWSKNPEAEADTDAPLKAAKVETVADPEPDKELTEEEEEAKLPKGLKKRFRKLTGQIRDLEAAAAAAKAPAAAAEKVTPAVATPPAGKPDSKDFDSYEAYVEALTEWTADQRDIKREAAAAKKTRDAAATSQQSKWLERLTEAQGRHEDWTEVVDKATDVPITGNMRATIMEMDRGPDVVHFLAGNKAEAERISKLSDRAQVRELGRIEDAFEPLEDEEEETPAKVTKQPAAVSKAPKPARTVSGSTANDAGKEPDPKDYKKWSQWKDRQDAAEARLNS